MILSSRVLTIFMTVLVFISCKKDKQDGFPLETNTGANTLGFYVSNVSFIPCKTTGGISPGSRLQTIVNAYNSDRIQLTIDALNNCEKNYLYGRFLIINIDSVELKSGTTYKLQNFEGNPRNSVSCMYTQDLISYASDAALDGSLTITFYDKVKRILSGKFQATLKNMQGTDIVNLRGGLFDVTF